MKNLTNRKEIKRRKYLKSLYIRKLEQNEKLKIQIVSKIKNRSKKRNILNEISKDIEKIKIEPENLILIDFIDKKISNP